MRYKNSYGTIVTVENKEKTKSETWVRGYTETGLSVTMKEKEFNRMFKPI